MNKDEAILLTRKIHREMNPSKTTSQAIAYRYWRSLFAVLLLLIALCMLVFYGFSVSKRFSLLNFPLISVVQEIREEAIQIQLHLEKIATHQIPANTPVSWQELEQAIWHLDMMVGKPGGNDPSKGSGKANQKFKNLLEKLENHLFVYQASVRDFLAIRKARFGEMDFGPVIEEYKKILDDVGIIETTMIAELNDERRDFRIAFVGMSVFSLLMVSIAGFFFWRFERQQVEIQEILERSKDKLEDQVDERTRMLASANERLLSYQEQLRRVSSELLQTQERERRQIAIEIHDRIGQALAVAKIQLGALTAMLENPSKLAAVEEIRTLVTQAIQDTRTLTFELSPPVLYELGLQAALEWLAETIQAQSGLQVFVTGNQHEERLDTSRKVFLFRVVRELLFNVVKHADAQKVDVQVSKAAERIDIDVSDDGRGIEPHCLNAQDSDANQDQGFGLFSIREQLRYYNGQLTFKADEGKGTCATITMPLETSV